MTDPKLKEAMEEIKGVLRRHDIAGVALLSSPTHNEYLYHFCPSWTCEKVVVLIVQQVQFDHLSQDEKEGH